MITHEIRLYYNPYSQTLSRGVLLQILETAANNLADELQRMIDTGDTEKESFAVILADPTETREVQQPTDLALAAVLLGPEAEDLMPNALAKIDAASRHGVPNGALVDQASHCLGDDDFAWGHSAHLLIEVEGVNIAGETGDYTFQVALAAGSGLSAEQDHDMAKMILTEVMGQIRDRRDSWIAEQRREHGRWGWYNQQNQPPEKYRAILDLAPIAHL